MRLRTTSVLFGSNVLINLFGIVTGIIIARLLGPEGRGEVATYVFLPTFLVGLLNLSLPAAATLHIARIPGLLSRRVAISIKTVAVSAALLMGPLAFLILTFVDAARFTSTIGLIAITFVTSEILRATLLGIYAGSRSYVQLAAWRLMTPLLYLSLIITFGIAGLSVEEAVVSVAVANAASSIVLFLSLPFGVQFDLRFARMLVHSAVRFHPAGILRTLRQNLDKLIVVLLLPVDQIGLYFVAVTFASAPFTAAQQSLASQLLPEFSSVRAGTARNKMALQATFLASAFGVFLFLVLAALLPLIVPFLVGSEFASVVPVTVLLASGFVLRMVLVVVTAYLESSRAIELLTTAELTFFVGFIGAWIVLDSNTAVGIAWCSLVGFLVNTIYVAVRAVWQTSTSSVTN